MNNDIISKTEPNVETKKEGKEEKQSKKVEKTPEQKADEKLERKRIRNYKKDQRSFLLTSRFNTETREQNRLYRERKNPNGCIYCAPSTISEQIPNGAKLMVLEMDNDNNQIFAIGLLANRSYIKQFMVYDNMDYNRYNYVGKHRIKREDMTEKEEEIMKAFDTLCFKGNMHMKRGQGLKAFPLKIIMRCSRVIDLVKFVEDMFRTRFSKIQVNS